MEHYLAKLINQFKHRSVRDLAWVIASPPLVSGNIDDVHWWSHEHCLSEFNDCLNQLTVLDQQPEPLEEHLSNLKNKKLGSVFEGLVSFWLSTISPNYRERLHSVQIIEDKHTYGEIDFIIEEVSTAKIIHLEVAVKFYLGSEPYADAYRWFGTTTKDHLGKKIGHLRSHQTQLSKKHPKQLKNYFSEDIDERHCFVKGRLFYPEDSDVPPQNIQLTDNHLRGRWFYSDNIDNTNKLIKINKSHWLADFNNDDIQSSHFASCASVDSIDRAECYVETKKDKEGLYEEKRIFYLPRTFVFPPYKLI